MINSNVLFLSMIILFSVCGIVSLIINAHSKSRVPIFAFTVSGVLVIGFSVALLIGGNNSSQTQIKDYIPVTQYSETSNKNDRTTHKTSAPTAASDEKSDDDIVYITKHGTKYHFSIDCWPYDFYECTLREAKERGLEPCRNCAH